MEPVPDLELGTTFNGTQVCDIQAVIDDYAGRVYHYPLYRPLYEFETARLIEWLIANLHKPYDKFGAAHSGGKFFSLVQSVFRGQDLSTIFCSEYVAAAYANIGLLPDSNASRWSPNSLTRHLRRHDIVVRPFRIK